MGRLMKYELRSMSKLFIPIWLGVLALSIVNRFSVWSGHFENEILSTLQNLVLAVYIFAIIGVAIFALIYVILRFYQGLLKDEGYLTFTLPLKIDTILWGKALSALLIVLISGVVCVASIFIVVVRDVPWNEVGRIWQTISHELGGPGSLTLCCFLFLIAVLAGIVTSVMQLYLAMGLGQLSQKHKVGASVLSYVGINMAWSTIVSVLMTPTVMELAMGGENSAIVRFINSLKPMEAVWCVFGAAMVQYLVLTTVSYFITRYLFTKKLNLE